MAKQLVFIVEIGLIALGVVVLALPLVVTAFPCSWCMGVPMQAGMLLSQVLTSMIVFVYAYLTWRIARSTDLNARAADLNARATELNTREMTRPRLSGAIDPRSEQTKILPAIMNMSENDALVLVYLDLLVDGVRLPVNSPALTGKEVWAVPGQTIQNGFHEFSGQVKQTSPLNEQTRISAQLVIHYIAGDLASARSVITDKWYTDVREWSYDAGRGAWIPQISFSEMPKVPSPDWDLVLGRN